MPRTRKYESHKDRQAAYRARQEIARRQEMRDRGLPAMPALATMPGHTRWNAALKRSFEILTMVHAEMATYFDERTDTWREGDRGEALTERIEALESLCSDLEALVN